MAKRFRRQTHLKCAYPHGGLLGRHPLVRRRVEAFRAAWRLLAKIKRPPRMLRGAATPVSSGMRFEPKAKAWLPAQQPGSECGACAFLGLHSGRWQASHSRPQARMPAHSSSHSVVSNRRKLHSKIPERLPRVRIARPPVNREGEAKRP